MSIIIQQITFRHADGSGVFRDISFTISRSNKVALVGNNGIGKSTLLQIIANRLKPSSGSITCSSTPYYIPQHFGQYDNCTIAEVLGVSCKLAALKAILGGDASVENFTILGDDWTIEEKTLAALTQWGVGMFSLDRFMKTLSGGEKTKVFLSGIRLHQPEIILMDEPTNHLDSASRRQLYDFISQSPSTILVVSHDRDLLSRLSYIYELDKNGVFAYGGDYEFYKEEKRKKIEKSLSLLESKEKELRMGRKAMSEMMERSQKQAVRGEKASRKKCVARIALKTLKDRSEKTSSGLKDVHEEKFSVLSEELAGLKEVCPDISQMKVDFEPSFLHKGKELIRMAGVNFMYGNRKLWDTPLDFILKSGERIALEGRNGSGKTTFLKLLLGKLLPLEGDVTRVPDLKYVYLDQEYSMVDSCHTVYEQAQSFNRRHLPEHELKLRLNRFLFSADTWNKSCGSLSGGERMRLALCCLMIDDNNPDLFILDEPTNNIDLRNMEIVTSTVRNYKGTVIVVSHDSVFKEEIGVDRIVELR